MKVYVLMFGFEYEGFNNEVRVFASEESAKAEGDRVMKLRDEDGLGFDYYSVKEVEVEK